MVDDAPQAGEPIEINSCDDVLSHVFEFLDHETDDARRAVIAEHLEDCSSCLREFGIEQEFKALVRRRCGGDKPPTGLRERIKLQLTTVSFEEDGTQISVEKISTETFCTLTLVPSSSKDTLVSCSLMRSLSPGGGTSSPSTSRTVRPACASSASSRSSRRWSAAGAGATPRRRACGTGSSCS
jgi:mycothiol system anti-sigma-R factor